MSVYTFLVFFSECGEDAQKGVVQARNQQLPPDWHNVYHPEHQSVFYYNSATGTKQWEQPPLLDSRAGMPSSSHTSSAYIVQGILQQLVGVTKPLTTIAVYGGLFLKSALALQVLIEVACHSSWAVAIVLSDSFAALPQPLPFLIYYFTNLSKPMLFHYDFELGLRCALVASLLPMILSYYQTMRSAAQARLEYCDLSWDAQSCWRLLCATCHP